MGELEGFDCGCVGMKQDPETFEIFRYKVYYDDDNTKLL